MQRLEVSGAVRLIYKSLCVKELKEGFSISEGYFFNVISIAETPRVANFNCRQIISCICLFINLQEHKIILDKKCQLF